MITRLSDIDRSTVRSFAFLTAGVLSGLFGAVFPWLFGYPWPAWPWITSFVLAFWGLLHPASMRPLYQGWMKAARLLGIVNSYVIFTAVFIVVITPVGIVMRLLGHDPLTRRTLPHESSYRKKSNARSHGHMEKPY